MSVKMHDAQGHTVNLVSVRAADEHLYQWLKPTKKPWLNLGCGFAHIRDAVNVDSNSDCFPDKQFDLTDRDWPLVSDLFGYVCAVNVLEHVPDLLSVMGEVWRVLSPGGCCEIIVPYWLHTAAIEDPTHVRSFGRRSAGYFEAATYNINTSWYTDSRFNFVVEETRLIGDSLDDTTVRLYHKLVCEADDPASQWIKYMIACGDMPGFFRYILYRLIKAPLPDPPEPILREIVYDLE
jgi:SAM-dependent methyltransferase